MTSSEIDDHDRPAWHARAECARRGLPTEFFFPASADPDRWDQRALDACAACPVSTECLEWAIKHNEPGIWAGTGEEQRARIRRARQRGRGQK